MKEDHANMPGMGDQSTKPEQGKAAAPPKASPAPKPDASTKPDTPRTPRKS